MPFYSKISPDKSCGLNSKQIEALGNLGDLVVKSPTCDYCKIDYLSAYTPLVYNPYLCEEYSNVSNIIHISDGGFYTLGGDIKLVYFPTSAPNGTRIILKDSAGTWHQEPLRVLNFSLRCPGIKLNKKGIVASFVFSSSLEGWVLESWSYQHNSITSPQCTITNRKVTLVEGLEGAEYYVRIVGTGHSSYVDINNIWAGEEIYQVFFYPEKGELIVDIAGAFPGPLPPESIEFTPVPLGDNSGLNYYGVSVLGNEVLGENLKRQRLVFDSARLDMLMDGDIFLRDIYAVLINKDTLSRDSILVGETSLSEINIFNAETFYLYEEHKDYIFKANIGEIIPTINGRLRPGDELILRYTKLDHS
jgi:hypothetical protein